MGKTIDKTYSVYCHTTPSGKRYVGVTSNPKSRWNEGRGYDRNPRFKEEIDNVGWDNIKHEIMYSDLSCDEAKKIEQSIISKWDLNNPDNGFNYTHGGDGPFSNETRRKMSESRMGNNNCAGRILSDKTKNDISNSLKQYYKTHSNPFEGKHHSQETINNLKSRIISDETREKMRINHPDVSGSNNPSAKRIVQMDLQGNVLKTYECASYAAKELNVDLSSIIKCCRGKKNTCGGYKWSYC